VIQGDLNVRRTGAIDGWCWDSDRPAARLTVELLVDGATVATVAADAARRDLQRRGIGDGRHAFNTSVDAARLSGGERLVSARDGRSRVVFGQYFVGTPEPPPPDPSLDALEDELGRLSHGLGRLMAAREAAPNFSHRLRRELSTLAGVLRAPGIHAVEPMARQVAAARAVLAREVGPFAVAGCEPAITVVLLDAGSTAGWARLVAADGRHELLLPDLGDRSLLPSLSRSLRTFVPGSGLAATLAAACASARAPVVAVVDSPGSLAALDDVVGRLGDGILIGAAVLRRARARGHWAESGTEVPAIAATGLLVAASAVVLSGLNAKFDNDPVDAVLDLVARHPDRRCSALVEPWQPSASEA